jgi:catechol 2,3-dioxygenase-like lactoylglutathione lyase family enzyme
MNQITEIALFTDDVTALAAFYERLTGAAPLFASSDIALFRLGSLQLLLHHKQPPNPQYEPAASGPPNEDHMAITVAQVDEACTQLNQAGIQAAVAPRDYPWGRSAYLRDPDGRLVELQQANPG